MASKISENEFKGIMKKTTEEYLHQICSNPEIALPNDILEVMVSDEDEAQINDLIINRRLIKSRRKSFVGKCAEGSQPYLGSE